MAELTEEGLSPARIRNVVSVLALVLDLARDARALRDNPVRGIRLSRSNRVEPNFLNADQVARVADSIRDEYRFFILLAAYCGLHPGGMCGLRVRRLDMVRRRVHVAETLQPIEGELISGPPKSYEIRTVPIPGSSSPKAKNTSTRGRSSSAYRSSPTTGCSGISRTRPRVSTGTASASGS